MVRPQKKIPIYPFLLSPYRSSLNCVTLTLHGSRTSGSTPGSVGLPKDPRRQNFPNILNRTVCP